MYQVLKMSSSHFRHPRPRRSKGFTLIELLVVVSIIALLVAILVPALKEAQEAAQNVVCQSNLHQIAIATQIFIDDNDRQMRTEKLDCTDVFSSGFNLLAKTDPQINKL